MIDPLTTAALPPPSRATARDGQPGVPSFLEWTLANPDSGSDPDGTSGRTGDEGLPGSVPPRLDAAGLLPASAPAIAEPRAISDPAATLPPARSGTDAGIPAPAPLDTSFSPLPGGLPVAEAMEIAGIDPRIVDTQATVEVPFGAGEIPHRQEGLATTLQFHVRKPEGEREVVALPWRLMASGRLAQSLAGRGSPLLPGTATGAPTTSLAAHAAARGPLRADAPTRAEGEPAGSIPAEALMSPPISSTAEARDPRRSSPATIGMASSPAAAEWMARWIKWVERDGHDPVLWLRDYRIDDQETRRVVDALRGLAREQGISLERIVVNGREFWRNPDHESNRSKE